MKLIKFSAQPAIALIIIGLSFFFIGYMLWMQDHTTSEIRSQIEGMINSHGISSNQTALLAALQETDKSNQSTFNILLPVFAAWVTAVVAFYFHTQTQNQAQDTIQKLSSQITGQVSSMTIDQLLKRYPDSGNVVTVKPTDTLKTVQDQCTQFGNVVVIDENGKPLGLIYSSSLLSLVGTPDSILKDSFDKITDPITGDLWSKEGKVNNYASLTLQDLVSDAKQKMDNVKLNDQRIRGLVMVGSKVAYIVNYQMLTQPLSNQ
ncbi:MAG: CBS domain-containing protein [Nitrososphaera sp.]|jgi:hypothetical protein